MRTCMNKLVRSHVHLRSPKMESDLLHIVKEVVYIAVGPVIGVFAWIGKLFHKRVNLIEYKINHLDKEHAVCEAKVEDIKEDIHNIDKKLDKILDKVRK